MVDTVKTTTTGNDNDDWEVAVDTGEFDKRLEQQEKTRESNPEFITSAVPTVISDDNSQNNASFDIMKSNKPIRILKRPTSQSQLSTNNDVSNSSTVPTSVNSINTISTTITSTNNENNTNNSNSSSSHNSSSSTTVPVISIIPRNQTKDSINSSESIATPVFSTTTTSSSSQSTKPTIKTYEQRELEYRLARLRIMGEEESSAKDDDDDDTPITDGPSLPIDETTTKTTSSSSSIRSTNKMNGYSPSSLQCHSTPGSYASDLYTLNNIPSNTGAIHFTPNNTTNNNSTPNITTGPFSSPNFSQHYRNPFTGPYSHLLPTPSGISRYPLPTTTTHNPLYMTSTAPFINATAPSSSISSSYHYPLPPPPPQHPNMTNNWYPYQHSQAPYGTQQYGHPQ